MSTTMVVLTLLEQTLHPHVCQGSRKTSFFIRLAAHLSWSLSSCKVTRPPCTQLSFLAQACTTCCLQCPSSTNLVVVCPPTFLFPVHVLGVVESYPNTSCLDIYIFEHHQAITASLYVHTLTYTLIVHTHTCTYTYVYTTVHPHACIHTHTQQT